ncbi:MAG: glycoside hydrolase family 16 protein [Opitutales bacterium]|nr:glycoside hydrolase family 16 protein [Opitutales bacterium]
MRFKIPFSPTLLIAGLLTTVTSFAAGGNWTLVWADEFDVDGPPNPANWDYDLGGGGWGNSEIQTYTDSLDNARVEDGRLIIEVRQNRETARNAYTSARLVTRGLHAWQYGRIEFRARLPKTTGTWSAVWMLSENAIFDGAFWPDNGEIDLMEHVGYEEDPLFHAVHGSVPNNIHGTLHTKMRNHLTSTGLGGSTLVENATEEFNTYAIVWLEDRIEFEVNGVVYNTIHKAQQIPVRNPPDDISPYWPFDQPFHLIVNVAVGGDWGGHFNSGFYPDDSPYGPLGIDHDGEWPQRMEIEYIRVYAPSENAESWLGFPVQRGYADTGDWLGPVNISNAPWLYSADWGWFNAPEEAQNETGGWIWLPAP